MSTHTIRARQRNDRDIVAVDEKIEILEAKIAVANEELADLHRARRGILAQAQALREDQA